MPIAWINVWFGSLYKHSNNNKRKKEMKGEEGSTQLWPGSVFN
jgi:hypothetical protein